MEGLVSASDLVSLSPDLGTLPLLADGVTRSISAENPTGASGEGGKATDGAMAEAARELGQGWKVSPWFAVPGTTTITLADIAGPAAIQHFWITCDSRFWRALILRCYWDDEKTPSVEVPLGDFFCNGWCLPSNVSSVPVAVNPLGGLNSYWSMPFRGRARITIENVGRDEVPILAYQITYCEAPVGDDAAYFHARWYRSNPVGLGEIHPIVDIRGRGQYVGTYMAIGVNNTGWWGEGEVKFFVDDDDQWPTICGTGTEDYFGGAWCFEQPKGEYATYSTPFLGLNQVIRPDGLYQSQQRFGMYRWHVKDPIRFRSRLRVTVQDLGWRSPQEGQMRFMTRQDDIATTAFWYQVEPHGEHAALPDANTLEVI
jgi:hypothetical protein